MTPAQVKLLQDSLEDVGTMSTSLAKLFYGRLFTLEPGLRKMFTGGIDEQVRKLMDTVEAAVASAARFDELRPALRELGRKHLEYAVRPEHYPMVTDAFLWALSHALPLRPETRAAWSELLDAVNAEMLAGAAQMHTEAEPHR